MAEQVNTGGLMQFDWKRQRQSELDPERRDAIEQGYAEAEERKRKERRNQIWILIIVVLLIMCIAGYFLFR